jgi:hypothetical protein
MVTTDKQQEEQTLTAGGRLSNEEMEILVADTESLQDRLDHERIHSTYRQCNDAKQLVCARHNSSHFLDASYFQKTWPAAALYHPHQYAISLLVEYKTGLDKLELSGFTSLI